MNYAEKKLMRLTKKELCEKVIMLGLRCVELETGFDSIENEVKELITQNNNLELEAKRDSTEYYELLKYKNHIMKKYRDELKNTLPEEGIFPMEDVTDLGGNIVCKEPITLK